MKSLLYDFLWALLSRVIQIMWDCDNTLAHVELPACTIAYNLTAEEYKKQGVDLRSIILLPTWLEELPGKTLRDFLIFLAENRGGVNFEATELDRIASEEDVRVCAEFSAGAVTPAPGLLEVLSWLRRVKMAVVSNSSLMRVIATLRGAGLEQYFDEKLIFSARDCSATKPSPEVYERALKVQSAFFNIAVEDSGSGVKAAAYAGVPLILYCGAYENPSLQSQKLSALAKELGAVYEVVLDFDPRTFKRSVVNICIKQMILRFKKG